MTPSSKSTSSSLPSKSKSSGKPSSSKSSSSKKPSRHDPDSDDERHSPSSRKSSSKKADKKESPSFLKSVFTKDKGKNKGRSEGPKVLESKYFKDESSRASSTKPEKSDRLDSAMFRDETLRHKSEKKSKKVETIEEEDEEYTEEPDFSQFVSKYEVQEEVEKVEKKAKKSAKPEASKSRYKSDLVAPSAKYESSKVKSKVKSVANFQTAFTDNYDIEMAAKQSQIAAMTGQELEEQEKWAFEKLKAHAGTCPMGFAWDRYTEEAFGKQVRLDGYRCRGGGHLVTHEMVAAGKGETMQATEEYINRCYSHPFSGVKWEVAGLQDMILGFGASLLHMARGQPPGQPISPLQAAGNGGWGNSSNDPFTRPPLLPSAVNRFARFQQQQPGGGLLRLAPTYDPNQPTNNNAQQGNGRR